MRADVLDLPASRRVHLENSRRFSVLLKEQFRAEFALADRVHIIRLVAAQLYERCNDIPSTLNQLRSHGVDWVEAEMIKHIETRTHCLSAGDLEADTDLRDVLFDRWEISFDESPP